jgi:hypothetical protein
MKKILLLLCIFISVRVFAQTGNLIIYTDKGDKVWVVLDSIKQNKDPQANIKITGLSSPDYDLRIIFEDKSVPDMEETVHLSMPDVGLAGEYTYMIKKKDNGKYVLRFKDAVPMAQAVPSAPGQAVIAYNASRTGANAAQQAATTTGGYVPGYSGQVGCPKPMNDSSFSAAKSSIMNATFETDKQTKAKLIITNNCLTTDQVIQVLGLFELENTKLDIAKLAYTHTYDKDNYTKVNDLFNFDSNKTDLGNYIKSH